MKAWTKLEEKLNLMIAHLSGLLSMFISKSTPSSIKASIQKRKGKPLFNFQETQAKLLSIKDKIDGFKAMILAPIGKFVGLCQNANVKKLDFKKIFIFLFAIASPFLGRLRDWYVALKPTTLLAMVSMGTMGSLSSIAIYQQVQKISEKTRAPASEEIIEEVGNAKRRPAYYKKQERELKVRNISFPIYIESKSKAQKLVLDFTFVSSNRYIKEYFFENSHLLRDRLNMSLEQIQHDFPLEDDGKRVIKEKIIKEMKALIIELKIEGDIEEVHIHSIMAG